VVTRQPPDDRIYEFGEKRFHREAPPKFFYSAEKREVPTNYFVGATGGIGLAGDCIGLESAALFAADVAELADIAADDMAADDIAALEAIIEADNEADAVVIPFSRPIQYVADNSMRPAIIPKKIFETLLFI
jgi:hypothetical protein